jgi:hypothetical protein
MRLSDKFKGALKEKGFTNKQIEDVLCGMEKTYFDVMEPGKHYLAVNNGVDDDKVADFPFSGFRYIGMHPYTTEDDVKNALDDLQVQLITRFGNLSEVDKQVYNNPAVLTI